MAKTHLREGKSRTEPVPSAPVALPTEEKPACAAAVAEAQRPASHGFAHGSRAVVSLSGEKCRPLARRGASQRIPWSGTGESGT